MDEGVTGAAYREAQESVIGSLLIDAEHTIGPVMDAVGPESFDGEYRTVFSGIRKLWMDRQPVDPVTVLSECGDAHEPLLRRCMDLTPTTVNAGKYAELVRRQSRVIGLRGVGAALMGAVDEDDARRIIARAEELLMQRTRPRVFGIQALVGEFYGRMDREKPKYIPWGIWALEADLRAGRHGDTRRGQLRGQDRPGAEIRLAHGQPGILRGLFQPGDAELEAMQPSGVPAGQGELRRHQDRAL